VRYIYTYIHTYIHTHIPVVGVVLFADFTHLEMYVLLASWTPRDGQERRA
jgi:hypothetical protein